MPVLNVPLFIAKHPTAYRASSPTAARAKNPGCVIIDVSSLIIEVTYRRHRRQPEPAAAVTILDDGDELLFVYGTLMNPAERVLIIGRPIDASPGRLPGYARGRKGHYFVAKQAGAVTDGAILEGLSGRELKILDEYEEAPALYTRERIEVLDADGRRIECWIYMPTDWGRG
jgi:gamma-glutamylcyclotransferase (GGCT)/AIG2-like uncharacterized protein YtfP